VIPEIRDPYVVPVRCSVDRYLSRYDRWGLSRPPAASPVELIVPQIQGLTGVAGGRGLRH
jgi:hypothetical protein